MCFINSPKVFHIIGPIVNILGLFKETPLDSPVLSIPFE